MDPLESCGHGRPACSQCRTNARLARDEQPTERPPTAASTAIDLRMRAARLREIRDQLDAEQRELEDAATNLLLRGMR